MNRIFPPALAAVLLFAASAVQASEAAPDAAAGRPQLLVLGSFHMASPNRDVANMQVDEMLAEGRQREIEQVVDALARFRPTRIAVEWPRGRQAELDTRYRDHLAGEYELSRSETDQVAMRLAARLGLERLDAVEVSNTMPPVEMELVDYEAGARRLGKAGVLEGFRAEFMRQVEQADAVLREGTVGDALRWLNTPEQLDANYRTYFQYTLLAQGDDTPGANWLQFWFGRNLKIFGSLAQLAGPGERVLVVYGAGHAPYLRRFAQDSGMFEVLDPLDYLPPPQR